MRSTKIKSWAACVLAILMVYSFGCIFNPKPDDNPDPPDPIEWPDLTEKEDVIEYMLLVYEDRNKERYPELLHEHYIWVMQDKDAEELHINQLDKVADIRGTNYLLGEASILELEIDPGSWGEVEAVGEEPCPGCWETEREYHIQVKVPIKEKPLQGHDLVKFIVVPVEKDGKKIYQIRWAYDKHRQW